MCAAIPVIKVLRESMIVSDVTADRRHRQRDDQLHPDGHASTVSTYEEALAEAQALGYAEADPTDDVTGGDAAAKIAILASIAFHTRVMLDEVVTSESTGSTGSTSRSRRTSATASSSSPRAARTPAGVVARVSPVARRPLTIRWHRSRAHSTP